MALIAHLLLLLFASVLTAGQEEQCYWRSNGATGVISDGGWFACNNTQQVVGGAQLCCLQNSQCGTDALCHQPSSGGGSGWFVGGCTDPTYQDPVCRSSCTNDAQTWIQYNYTSQLWHCCGDDACTGTPTSETFQAAPPEQFSAVPSAPQSSSASFSASTNAPTASPSEAPAESSAMSTGAKAGIGVLAAVSAIAIAAALAFFMLWRKAKKARSQGQGAEERWQQEQQQGMMQQHNAYAHYGSHPANYYPSPPPEPPQEVGVAAARRPELAGEAVDERK